MKKNPSQLNKLPFIGAQVFIEPGQTGDEICSWFKVMSEQNMTVCRIRMFESYMRDEENNWDFGLFDLAFEAAEKYGIKVWATLYPVTGDKLNIGGDKFPDTIEKQASIAMYIDNTVNHFKSRECLAGWVLINEPGVQGIMPEGEFTSSRYNEWEKEQIFPSHTAKGYPVLMDFKKEKFLLDYTTWFLHWIADEIRKHDSVHELHVNSYEIFVNCSEYNFPEWRSFLTSLGGSAHASWHFHYFTRDKYAVAMSADCEMIYSGAGHLPWFMTEIQGGNNTYSGFAPFCPTSEEIAQWLWITLGTQGKGAIFWTLNPRSSGIEAGEWGMLDLQDNPTDRMIEAGKVAGILNQNEELFARATKSISHISILYCRESLWAEKQMTLWESDHEARHPGAVMKSVLGWFEAFCEMGISPELKAINEFDFSKGSYTRETIILSHQLSMPSHYADTLRHFVEKGGKLIVDGLTAYFDEDMHHSMKTGFDYELLFGGTISEFKFQQDIFDLNIGGIALPCHMWKGYTFPTTGQAIFNESDEKVGIRNRLGEGEVVWIPSLIGLGCRMMADLSGLQEFILKELEQSVGNQTVRFQNANEKTLMKTLLSGDSIITILINKNKNAQKVDLVFKKSVSIPEIIYTNYESAILGNTVMLQPEETRVIRWR